MRGFKTYMYHNEHDSVKEAGEKGKKLCNVDPRKSCSTTHVPFLSSNPRIQKTCPEMFPTKVRLTKCSAQEKQKKRG